MFAYQHLFQHSSLGPWRGIVIYQTLLSLPRACVYACAYFCEGSGHQTSANGDACATLPPETRGAVAVVVMWGETKVVRFRITHSILFQFFKGLVWWLRQPPISRGSRRGAHTRTSRSPPLFADSAKLSVHIRGVGVATPDRDFSHLCHTRDQKSRLD